MHDQILITDNLRSVFIPIGDRSYMIIDKKKQSKMIADHEWSVFKVIMCAYIVISDHKSIFTEEGNFSILKTSIA